MIRFRVVLVALAALVTLGLGAGTSQAQDYPGTPPTTALAPCQLSLSASAAMRPGVTLTITVACERIVSGRVYTGVLTSTPVALPATTAAGNQVTFSNVRLPADFALNATHTVRLFDQATGALVGSVQFYVDEDGVQQSRSTGSNARGSRRSGSDLPKTGTDYVDPALKTGAALVAAGGLALVISKRRRAGLRIDALR